MNINVKKCKTISYEVLQNLYGVDIDKIAVYFTRINLWMAFIKIFKKQNLEFSFKEQTQEVFSILEESIVLGDSILYIPIDPDVWTSNDMDLEGKIHQIVNRVDNQDILDNFITRYFPKLSTTQFSGFKLIIGNPPYISSKDLPYEYKELLRGLYSTAIHQFDLYSIFVELSISILSKKGFFAFIIPESYLGRSSFTENRRLLLKSTQILKIENIQHAFPRKSVSNIIIFFQKELNPSKDFDFVYYPDKEKFTAKSGSSISIPQQYCVELEDAKILCHPEEIRNIIQVIYSNSTPLNTVIKIHRGEEIGKRSPLIMNLKKKNSHKIVAGEDIKKFRIENRENYILDENIQKKSGFYFIPKILLRQLGSKIQAAFDEYGEFVSLQTVYNIISINDEISHEFLLGLLNSDLIQFYYENLYREKQIFPRILLENIIKIPFVFPSKDDHDKISNLVRKIIHLSEFDQDTSKELHQLNLFVYKIFRIKEKEMKIIEKDLNPV